jgi:hypothetical protein
MKATSSRIRSSREKKTVGLSLNWRVTLPGQWTQRCETAGGVAEKRETWTGWPSLVWLRARVAALTRSERRSASVRARLP